MRLKNILIVLLTLSIALLAQTKKPAKATDTNKTASTATRMRVCFGTVFNRSICEIRH